MRSSDGGKGDWTRPEAEPGSYREGWERTFGETGAASEEGSSSRLCAGVPTYEGQEELRELEDWLRASGLE